jgi:hypothetical protein
VLLHERADRLRGAHLADGGHVLMLMMRMMLKAAVAICGVLTHVGRHHRADLGHVTAHAAKGVEAV